LFHCAISFRELTQFVWLALIAASTSRRMSLRFSDPEHEPILARDERRGRGVYYTPPEIAAWITRATYGPLVESWNGKASPPRVLDPACGGGVFLKAAEKLLGERCDALQLSLARRQSALNQAIFGCDIDATAVRTAREQLGKLQTTNIRCEDTLQRGERNCFDVIVGNPPYVSIRELARTQTRAAIDTLRDRFHTARGNFDLYVPFWERALELLRPGGRLGFIVPNKWATLDYAKTLRELLLSQTTLEQIVDVSALRVFPEASTYPQIVVLQKRTPSKQHPIRVTVLEQSSQLQDSSLERQSRNVLQSSLNASGLFLGENLDVESHVHAQPLGSLCTLHSGASGYSGSLIAGDLREAADMTQSEKNATAEFIVSGNIDRYAIIPGNVRFLKQAWQRPCLPLTSEQITADKARLYREPKIVFSGMCRRLEAAYDDQGYALGVQVFAARELQVDPFYLLAILNSKLLSYLFRERFAAKRLAGGYLAINKGQLAQLPIRLTNDLPAAKVKQLARLAHQLHQSISAAVEQQLDELVYELYELSSAERQRVKLSFEQAARKPQRTAA
jgi:SAM-dependent methyltransferase